MILIAKGFFAHLVAIYASKIAYPSIQCMPKILWSLYRATILRQIIFFPKMFIVINVINVNYFLQVSSLSFRSKQEHTMSQMTKCIPMGISFEIIQVNKEAKGFF